jgi:hypothetical protein
MTNMLRRGGAALTACAISIGWSMPLANGSEAQASDPGVPVSGPTTTNSTSYRPVPAEFSLTISPTRLVAGPADTGKPAQIVAVNRGQLPVTVTVQKRDFTGGLDGALVFHDKSEFSASEWVTLDLMSFEVAPGASRVITAAITVPPNPDPGDHQVAIVFVVLAQAADGDNIKINRGIAIPAYVTVAGPTDDSATVTDLRAPAFATTGPVAITARVRNTGTVHRDFRGTTRLRMNDTGAATVFPDFTIDRGSVREVATTWDPPLMCICHPAVSFVNADGSVQSATVRVIVFPLHLLGVVVGVLLVLWLGTRLWRRRYRAKVASAAARLMANPTGDPRV